MKFAWLLLVIVIAIPLVACGSSGSGPAGNQLPPHITSVSPADGTVISRQDLISQGITANFDFRVGKGFGNYPTNLVRFYINKNNDVTMKLHWTITKDNPPSSGSFLYEPGGSISSGWKTLKIWYWNIDGHAPTDHHYEYIWRIYVKD
jgi:hypothetical protein